MERMIMYSQEPTVDQEQNHATCPNCVFLSPVHSNSLKRERPLIPPLYPSSSSCPYTRLPLSPPPTTTTAFPHLRRCTSDPVPLMMADENAKSGGSADVAKPWGLCRSVSAPEKDLISASAHPIGESPESKRLKRMKEQMREISKWCDQVIAEGGEEGDDDGREDHLVGPEVVNNEAPKDAENEGRGSEEEAVSVEKNGDCLIIHLKCPCLKSYQFLISRNNCYYKIM